MDYGGRKILEKIVIGEDSKVRTLVKILEFEVIYEYRVELQKDIAHEGAEV